MLALDGIREALDETTVVAVSPFVEDRVFSGPAGKLMDAVGYDPRPRASRRPTRSRTRSSSTTPTQPTWTARWSARTPRWTTTRTPSASLVRAGTRSTTSPARRWRDVRAAPRARQPQRRVGRRVGGGLRAHPLEPRSSAASPSTNPPGRRPARWSTGTARSSSPRTPSRSSTTSYLNSTTSSCAPG